MAGPEDLPAVARLAALDSSEPPPSPLLVAEIDGQMRVAVSLSDLRTIADPFHHTMHVQAMARARAQQLRGR